MDNFWRELKRPFLVLAPMAGYTDQPFRLICKEFGADVMFSEMISSEAISHQLSAVRESESRQQIADSQLFKTLKLIQFSQSEQPFVVQIFGANPDHLAYAAEYISAGQWQRDYAKIQNSKCKNQNDNVKFRNLDIKNLLKIENYKLKISSIPSGIDVNMGCPAKDVVKTGAGSALMRNPKLATQIIKAIKKKTKLPISVKTRLGWDNSKSILVFCRTLEQAGADAITIHGRTYRQGFNGEADWEMIYKVKKQLKIPVVGNGGIGISSQSSALSHQLSGSRKLKAKSYKLDGYMIGRGALGKPWLFQKLSAISRQSSDSLIAESEKLRANNRKLKAVVLKHAKLVQKIKGERGIVEFRKHLVWYFKDTPGAKKIRQQLVRVNTLQDIIKAIDSNQWIT